MNNDGEDVRIYFCTLCLTNPAEEGEKLCRSCREAQYEDELPHRRGYGDGGSIFKEGHRP